MKMAFAVRICIGTGAEGVAGVVLNCAAGAEGKPSEDDDDEVFVCAADAALACAAAAPLSCADKIAGSSRSVTERTRQKNRAMRASIVFSRGIQPKTYSGRVAATQWTKAAGKGCAHDKANFAGVYGASCAVAGAAVQAPHFWIAACSTGSQLVCSSGRTVSARCRAVS
jgi:hypothetical protein